MIVNGVQAERVIGRITVTVKVVEEREACDHVGRPLPAVQGMGTDWVKVAEMVNESIDALTTVVRRD